MHHPVIFADEHLIAVYKPHKLLSVPGLSEPENLFDTVKSAYPNARTIHRLDMATSGLILFALNYHAQKHISLQFEHKTITKTYIALLRGRVTASQLDIVAPLTPSQTEKTRHKVDYCRGKFAHTLLQKTAASEACTRVILHPLTGRSHQLRVHCQYIGHPIIGDPFYGDCGEANRLMLHAQTLALRHPVTGERLTLTCASPF